MINTFQEVSTYTGISNTDEMALKYQARDRMYTYRKLHYSIIQLSPILTRFVHDFGSWFQYQVSNAVQTDLINLTFQFSAYKVLGSICDLAKYQIKAISGVT